MSDVMNKHTQHLRQRVQNGDIVVGVIGLGYVGLPLAVTIAESGFKAIGFEVSKPVVESVQAGRSHIGDVEANRVQQYVNAGTLEATTDFDRLAECDLISICVPTPLNKIKDPDLSYVVTATQAIRARLRPGQIVILESTTYPGTTDEVIRPILQETGLVAGEDFFLAYSPERVDPGNKKWHTRNTPKVLGGVTAACTEAATVVYDEIFESIVPLENARAAELVKVYENTFRMINIALANELAQACDILDVDVWGVIEAAATKPFGFMKFTPGPGLGGHCIPLDPHYLSWKMRTLSYKTRMIELASEINAEMPRFVVQKIVNALNTQSKAVRGSRILILGIAYKRDVADLRESPALEIMQLLQAQGALLSYHDNLCPTIPDDGNTPLANLPLHNTKLTVAQLRATDVAVIITDHSDVDYNLVKSHAPVVIDTRGVISEKRA